MLQQKSVWVVVGIVIVIVRAIFEGWSSYLPADKHESPLQKDSSLCRALFGVYICWELYDCLENYTATMKGHHLLHLRHSGRFEDWERNPLQLLNRHGRICALKPLHAKP